VWHANLAENFNVSIPYMQIKSTKVRESKFGTALVIETSQRSGGYTLGFRIKPDDKLNEVFKQIKTFHEVFSANPVLGIKSTVQDEKAATSMSPFKVDPKTDEAEIVEDDRTDALALYCADADRNKTDRPPVYYAALGLAVEKLKDGATLEELWSLGAL